MKSNPYPYSRGCTRSSSPITAGPYPVLSNGTLSERACPDGPFSGGPGSLHVAARRDRRARHFRSKVGWALNLATAALSGTTT